jgi:hypothetical protein
MGEQDRQNLGFAEHEYSAIATNTSQALQMMALLLTLYFLFNGALFTAVFTLLASTWGRSPVPYVGWLKVIDIVVFACLLLTLSFTLWSYFFVRSFRESVGIALTRGSEIEMLIYGKSSKDKNGFFSRMDHWISQGRTPRELARSSAIFFCLIESFWICIFVGSLSFVESVSR